MNSNNYFDDYKSYVDLSVPFVEARLKAGEFNYLKNKYRNIAFNYIDWNRHDNNADYLWAVEGYIIYTENYSEDIINKYKKFITYNSKFYNDNKNKYDITLVYPPDCDAYYFLDKFLSFEEKTKGVCCLNRIYFTNNEADIIWLRPVIMNGLNLGEDYVKDVYSSNIWGNDSINHKNILKFPPSHYENLKMINIYQFCLCMESTYHPYWSWDWVTERLWNCFRAKTVPIYLGCYNIEQLVPKDLYIDLRDYFIDEKKFTFDLDKLSNDLINFPKDRYIDMTEKAFEWQKTNKIGNVIEIEKVLSQM